MRLPTVAVFAAGYIIGARAGRERYAQIVGLLERTSQRLEEYSSRHGSRGQNEGRGDADSGS